jgi:hypothetical protein
LLTRITWPSAVLYAQCLAALYLAAIARFESFLTGSEGLHPTLYAAVYGLGTVLISGIFIWPLLLIAALIISRKNEKHPLLVLAASAILEVVNLIPIALVCH